MTKHRCQNIPRSTQIEYDWQWKWCWTTKNVMEPVNHCPYCGILLKEPTVTHIEMLGSLVDIHGTPLLYKGKIYEVARTSEHSYDVHDFFGCILVVPKKERGILYKCKEVL